MTNQQGAPEALRPIQRFNNIAGLMNPEARGLYVRYEDHVAALVEAQQPAPSAAAATEVENLRKALQFYADKDHFNIADEGAWDTVSGEPQNYWCDEEGTATVEDGTIARLALAGHQIKFDADEAPQPSPTPQADSAPLAAPADIVVLEAALRAIHQAIDLIGEPDTERLRTVRRVLRGAVVVAEDSTAPQADSQPAPEYVGNGMFKGETIPKAAEHWANWCDVRSIGGVAEFLRFVAKQADSVTAPAGGVAAGPIYRIRTKNTKHVVWTTVPKHEYLAALEAPEIFECELISTPPAQPNPLRAALLKCIAVIERTAHCNEADRLAAADEARQALAAQATNNMLEDAARLEQIAEAIRDYHHALDMRKHGGLAESVAFNSICQTMGMPWNQGEEAARRAARKQGANHD